MHTNKTIQLSWCNIKKSQSGNLDFVLEEERRLPFEFMQEMTIHVGLFKINESFM